MHGKMIDVLRDEWRSKFEGVPPSPQELLKEPWVSRYLQVMWGPAPATPSATMFPPPVLPVDTDPLCACGHDASEHPLDGACALCDCLGFTAAATPQARQEA